MDTMAAPSPTKVRAKPTTGNEMPARIYFQSLNPKMSQGRLTNEIGEPYACVGAKNI